MAKETASVTAPFFPPSPSHDYTANHLDPFRLPAQIPPKIDPLLHIFDHPRRIPVELPLQIALGTRALANEDFDFAVSCPSVGEGDAIAEILAFGAVELPQTRSINTAIVTLTALIIELWVYMLKEYPNCLDQGR